MAESTGQHPFADFQGVCAHCFTEGAVVRLGDYYKPSIELCTACYPAYDRDVIAPAFKKFYADMAELQAGRIPDEWPEVVGQ